MGNQSSAPENIKTVVILEKDVNIRECMGSDGEPNENDIVPEAFFDASSFTNASCSSSSEDDLDYFNVQDEEDQHTARRIVNRSSALTKTKKYEEHYNEDEDDDTPKNECYRLPLLFQRKSSPLTALDSFAGNEKDNNNDDDKQHRRRHSSSSSTCFPRNSSRGALLVVTPTDNALTTSSSTSNQHQNNLSFQSCRDALSENSSLQRQQESDDGDNESFVDALGCVTSPLGMSKNSASWTNLMGLEATTTTTTELSYTQEEIAMGLDGDLPTPESDLNHQGRPREYWIVTTAALPWMTGTAVNPLLRAAYLSQRNRNLLKYHSTEKSSSTNATIQSTVTLALPWLDVAEDRLALYGKGWEHATPQIQEDYIRTWLRDSAQMPLEADHQQHGGIRIQWYPARYHPALSSIFAMGDLCELIPSSSSQMICILEEPEHVNCYRAPGRESWRDKFPHVIGIVHTNYKAYAQNHYSGLLTGPLVGALSSLMVRAYCDKVVKLSPVLQSYAPYKEVVSNVHGIRQEFFQIPQNPTGASGIYFIGKLLWAKGLDKLLELEASYRKATGSYFAIDIYGSGPHEEEIQKAFLGHEYFSTFFQSKPSCSSSSLEESSSKSATISGRSSETGNLSRGEDNAAKRYWRRFRQPIPARFPGREDHAKVGATGNYKIFVNPSITEVLCTTTAEAVAMGFWVLIPKHSSNEFFFPFGNCLQYSNRREFVELLLHCQNHDPPGWCASEDRSAHDCYGALSWEAATQRLIETAFLSKRDARRCERLQPRDRNIQEWHYALGRGTRGDVIRKVLGGGPVADQSQYAATVVGCQHYNGV